METIVLTKDYVISHWSIYDLSGKIYSGPIEEMEDSAENQELQNTLREVREFIQGIWNKLEN